MESHSAPLFVFTLLN